MIPAGTTDNVARKSLLNKASTGNNFEIGQQTDAALFESFRDNGDVSAFERLFTRHRNALFAYLWAMSGSRAIADDLSQYCWLRLMESAAQGGYQPKPGVSIKSFLFALGRNRFIDEYRRKHVEVMSDSMDDRQPLAAAGGNACDEASDQQVRDAIEQAIADLPAEQREVLAMWLEGFSIKEMMSNTGAPRDTVLSRKKYALKKLRNLFDAAGMRLSDG
jgi:RNA polymerase sigma-70 factor (ECF subfamily)